jgi:hypothetical protein
MGRFLIFCLKGGGGKANLVGGFGNAFRILGAGSMGSFGGAVKDLGFGLSSIAKGDVVASSLSSSSSGSSIIGGGAGTLTLSRIISG